MNQKLKLIAGTMVPLLFILLSGCGQTDDLAKLKEIVLKNCDYKINDFILDKLAQNKIVMIGESGHGQYLYMKTVSDFLDHWITAIENEGTNGIHTKICLVLEMDPSYVRKLNIYIHSGDYRDLLDLRILTSTNITMANILFINDLRKIIQRVDECNEKTSPDNVQLEIKGPERNWDLVSWSAEEGSDYFIYQRDVDVKDNIGAYINAHPEYKILIYYGSAHLRTDKVMKKTRDRSGESYYLGHYLKSEYGNHGGFYRICQANPRPVHGPPASMFGEPDGDYIIENKYFKGSKEFRRIVHTDGDAAVIHLSKPYRLKPICTVLSENNTKFLIENLDSLKNLSLDFQQLAWGDIFNYLYTISGKEMSERVDYKEKDILDKEILKWKDWHNNSDHDMVDQIANLSIWNRLIDNLEKSPPDRIKRAEALLAIALDMEPLDQTDMSAEEKAGGYREYINKSRKNIVIDNLIPLLIIGTDQEREKALGVLKKETGKDFDGYREWVEWRYRVRSFE